MTPSSRQFAITAVLLAALASPARAADLPTPEIRTIERLDIDGAAVWAMRAAIEGTGINIGLGLACPDDPRQPVQATVFLGPFPPPGRRVQLAVRLPDRTVERFGPVVVPGPRAGFHSPRLERPRQIERFVDAALRTGSLVSNGHRSFLNRAADADNRAAALAFLDCMRRR